MEPFGVAPEEAQPAEEHDPGDGVRRLHQTGAGKIVVDESLGAEPGEQPPGDALFKMEVDAVVSQASRVLEDDRADRRLLAPLGQLLIAPPRRSQRIERRFPTMLAGDWRELPDRVAVIVRRRAERIGAEHFERTGQRVPGRRLL